MAAELRSLTAAGVYDEILPDWSGLTFSQDLVAPGTLTFSYPSTRGRHSDKLTHGRQIALLVDGVEPLNGRFTYDEGTGSRVAEADGNSTYSCKSNLARFDKLMFAPGITSHAYTATDFAYVNKSAGELVLLAINNAMSRVNAKQTIAGASWFTHPVTGFTTTTDSTGASWLDTYDTTFNSGNTVLDVINWVIENGFAEPIMDQKTLKLYEPSRNGTNLSTGGQPIVLQTGRDFTEATYQESSADLINALLVIGDANKCEWIFNQASIDTFGYREGTWTVSGVSDGPTLIAAGNAYLATRTKPRYAYTYAVGAMYLDKPYGAARPFIDYRVGDTILVLDGVETKAQRLRLLSATWDNPTAASVNLSVNDWFAEHDEELERRLKRLGG